MKKLIYVFAGHARSGKDTSAEILSEEIQKRYGFRPTHVAFADLLKEEAKKLGWDGEKDEKGRTLLQHLGDVLREYHGKEYFANACLEKIEESEHSVFVLTDLRYMSEYKALLDFAMRNSDTEVLMVFVSRENVGEIDGMTDEQRNHPSEKELDDIIEATDDDDVLSRFFISNDGSLEDLKKKVVDLYLLPCYVTEEKIKNEQELLEDEKEKTEIRWDYRNNRPRILLDMDDVVNDFLGALIKEYNEEHGTSIKKRDIKDWDLTKSEVLNATDAIRLFQEKGFFLSIPPKASSIEAINKMIASTKYDIYIVTACGSVEEYREKQEWLKKYIPQFNLQRLIMCTEKSIIRGDVLVDDKVQNLVECSPYMRTLLYDVSTNHGKRGFKRVRNLNQVLELLEKWFY